MTVCCPFSNRSNYVQPRRMEAASRLAFLNPLNIVRLFTLYWLCRVQHSQ